MCQNKSFMVIRKFLHSCILIEDHGKRLLIDPGAFSFVENKIRPEDIGAVDAILLSHKHPDHYFPDALKKILAIRSAPIVAHDEIGALMAQDGLISETVKTGETKIVAGFTISAFTAPHGPLPVELPHNLAYLVDERYLHPGDSLHPEGIGHIEVLGLPVAGPWLALKDALDWAVTVKPQHVIPIHDAIIKDFFTDRVYQMCEEYLSKQNIAFHPLKLGEVFEI